MDTSAAKNAVNNAKDAASQAKNLGSSAQNAANGMKDGALEAMNAVEDGVGGVLSSVGNIKDMVENMDVKGMLEGAAKGLACQLIDKLKYLFNMVRPPAATVDPVTILASMSKPGMSTSVSVGNIVASLNKCGIPTGPLPDGSPNETLMLITAIMSETQRMLREDANFQGTTVPGTSNVVVTGPEGPCYGTSLGGEKNAMIVK